MLKVIGPQVASDTSLRFTNLWNDVVARVLNTGISDLQRDSTLKTMTTYFSVALSNQARDYLRRRKRGEEIIDGMSYAEIGRQMNLSPD